jgi:hypothetical protein|tara:strand:+ start:38 stop:466 length:429 start_codon:yes stop_codon:yes gene_type:complete
MTTIRENILDAAKTALAGTTSVSTRIYRSRVTALSRAESPALLLSWSNDTATQTTSLATLDHTLTIEISVIVRGDTPDEVADPIVESLHNKIMSNTALSNLISDIYLTTTTNENVDADQPAGVITCSYEIKYRTLNNDLASV